MDARRFARPPLPARFIGNVVIWGSIIEPFSIVTPTPKGVIECAHSLWRTIKQYDDDDYLPCLIGAVKSVPDISRVELHRAGFEGRSLAINSWVTHGWYDLDWGRLVGGRCERVRVGELHAEDFCLVLPELKSEGNEEAAGLEVIICIKRRYMKMLRDNELFNRFAEWRCS